MKVLLPSILTRVRLHKASNPKQILLKLKEQVIKIFENFNLMRKGPIPKFSNGTMMRSHVPERHDIRESKGKLSNSSVQSILNDYVPSNHAKSLNNSPKRRQENPGRGRNLTLIESSALGNF